MSVYQRDERDRVWREAVIQPQQETDAVTARQRSDVEEKLANLAQTENKAKSSPGRLIKKGRNAFSIVDAGVGG